MKIFRSNRTTRLFETLVAELGERPLPPLERELIVVPSSEMQRWLDHQLSNQFGVWANAKLLFPRAAVVDLCARVDETEIGHSKAFEPNQLKWSIADLLLQDRKLPYLEEIAHYLRNDASSSPLLQISEQIAFVFDSYVAYRPNLLLQWEKGIVDGWQSEIWRKLVHRHGSTHLVSQVRNLTKSIQRKQKYTLPNRLSIFCVGHLPPLYLHAFESLGEYTDVCMYVRSPTPHFWEDFVSNRDMAKRNTTDRRKDEASIYDTTDIGRHELLASWGRLQRDFDRQVSDIRNAEINELFEQKNNDSNLGLLQRSIFELHDVEKSNHDNETSVQVHACSSRMREVQVLRDRIIDFLETDNTLEPKQIHILAPNISDYANEIEAVFRNTEVYPKIPIRIRTNRSASRKTIHLFLDVLELISGRMSLSSVFDILQSDSLSSKLSLQASQLEIARTLIEKSGVRWGIDGSHRSRFGLPCQQKHTWRAGIDRLMLGYVVDPSLPIPFGDTVPSAGLDTDSAEIIATLSNFFESISIYVERFSKKQTMDHWASVLRDTLAEYLEDKPATRGGIQILRDAIADLERNSACFNDQLSFDALRKELEKLATQKPGDPVGELDGIMCADLASASMFEARIICVLGLDTDSFPRVEHSVGFDKRKSQPRSGDARQRDRDLGALLDASVGAQDALVLLFSTAISANNAKGTPPIIDELCRSIGLHDNESSIVRHPQHAYSQQYFGSNDAKLFTYDKNAFSIANTVEHPQETPMFPNIDSEPKSILRIDDLVAWLWHPSRQFYVERLGLKLFDTEEELDPNDPTLPSPLAIANAGKTALQIALVHNVEAAMKFLLASPELASAPLGPRSAAAIRNEIQELRSTALALRGDAHPKRIVIDLHVGDHRIHDVLTNVYDKGLIQTTYARLGGRSELDLWVRHVCANTISGANSMIRSTLVARGRTPKTVETINFQSMTNSKAILQELVSLYRQSFKQPSALLPNASRAFAEASLSSKRNDPIQAARAAFFGRFGDSSDLHIREAFGLDPLVDTTFRQRFESAANIVYRPLLSNRGAK